MPELPEVETTRRGIEPHLRGRTVLRTVVRERRLRWPVPRDIGRRLAGRRIEAVERRGKYLLLRTDAGTAILHLGMSGSLRVLAAGTPAQPHDHLDLVLDDGHCLRLRDPRRFGSLHWSPGDPLDHPLLAGIGPEPLSGAFDGDYLHRIARGRRAAVKDLLMNARLVAGVGNIYANEALHRAGIDPRRPAGRLSRARCERLAAAVKAVLIEAIGHGGTTLRDFVREDGRPGYFRASLAVYDRQGLPCPGCGRPVRGLRQGQRATYYCAHCQR